MWPLTWHIYIPKGWSKTQDGWENPGSKGIEVSFVVFLLLALLWERRGCACLRVSALTFIIGKREIIIAQYCSDFGEEKSVLLNSYITSLHPCHLNSSSVRIGGIES